MIGLITVRAPVVHSPIIWHFVGQKCRFDLIEQVEHTGAALDGLIELEVKKPPTGFEKRSLSRGTAGIPDLASRAGTRAPGYSMPCTLM